MIIGHQKITDFLYKSRANNRLSHAYLFVGPEHIGKKTVALDFIKSLQCKQAVGEPFSHCDKCQSCLSLEKNSHPDVLFITPEVEEAKGKIKEKEITIKQIREAQKQFSLFSFWGPFKVAIINRAEKMTPEAANALLKTLEEPTAKTIIFLVSSKPGLLLQTIISRCLLIKFSLVKRQDIETGIFSENKTINTDQKQKILNLAAGKPGLAIRLRQKPEMMELYEKAPNEIIELLAGNLSERFKIAEKMSKDVMGANETLDCWTFFFRDLMMINCGCQPLMVVVDKKITDSFSTIKKGQIKKILGEITKTKKILNNSSFNAKLALEALMLNLT